MMDFDHFINTRKTIASACKGLWHKPDVCLVCL